MMSGDVKEKLAGKRFFITGHTGFKGSWLCLMLEMLGAEVCGFSREKEEKSLINITKPKLNTEVLADISNYQLLKDTVFNFKPDYIIHLASQAYVGKSIENPIETFDTNVVGLANLLKVAVEYEELKSILVITSDKCYKNLESDIPYIEDGILGAQDPYSSSKACQELLTESFRFTYFNKLAVAISTARASNVVGCADFNTSRLVPYLLDSFNNNKKPCIRNPAAVRPWQNILDVLGGYITLAYKSGEDIALSGAYNFGPGEDGFQSVESLAKNMSKYFNNSSYGIENSSLSSLETKILKLDSKKAKNMLGWKPTYSFEETIKMAVDFTQKANNAQNIKKICQQQINDYLNRF